MDKRRYPRIGMGNLSVDVNDGAGIFLGMVGDVSRNGLCMIDLSKKIDCNAKVMTIVVSGRPGHFKMNVRPRWYSDEGATKSVGAEIHNPSPDWMTYVKGFEPVFDKDVWDEIRF
jgi:hypothetical protein